MLLRVLLLQGVETSDGTLPKEIGKLIHLRYLGLRKTNIAQLPSSIGKLRNLLTLDYREVKGGGKVRMPDVVWEIEGLKHIYLPYIYGDPIPVTSFRLHSLKKLRTLCAGSLGGNWILTELPRLNSSVQKLIIRGITSQKHLEAASQCPSIRSDRLRSLELCWSHLTTPYIEMDDFGPIIHCQHLRKIKLQGRMRDGIQFPTCITMLRLTGSMLRAQDTLLALGKLPHLARLEFSCDSYTGKNWICSEGEFPKLQQLSVHELPQLEKWSIERGTMPQLRVLVISSCRKLMRIPKGLEFITTLQEFRIEDMSGELEKRLRGEDANIIQHVPFIQILSSTDFLFKTLTSYSVSSIPIHFVL